MRTYEQFEKCFEAEIKKSDNLPEGLHIGKIFRLPVCDGYAFYEIANIYKKTLRIKWRKDLCLDNYQNPLLGNGGNFPTKMIEPIVHREEALKRIFAKKATA